MTAIFFLVIGCIGLSIATQYESSEVVNNQTTTGLGTNEVINPYASNFSYETPQNRIYNGIDASSSIVPFIVVIGTKQPDFDVSGRYGNCAGSILNDRWIVSAAHCFTSEDIANNRVFVWVGAPNDIRGISPFNPPVGSVYSVRSGVVHPNYDPNTIQNDISLLQVSTPIKVFVGVGAICIPRGDFDNNQVVLVGWGKHDCKNSGTFKYAYGYSMYLRDCIATYNDFSPSPQGKQQICARLMGNQRNLAEQSNGDSGGPLIINRNNQNQLVGIVSFDGKGLDGCPQYKHPGVYTRTSYYIDWISSYGVNYFVCPN